MPTENASNRDACAPPRTAEVRALAERALAVVANRIAPSRRRTEEAMVRDLCNAMLQHGRSYQQVVLSRMAASGIGTAEIYETYLPAVARLLGERWVRDELSFIEVTHGAHRLQEAVRNYGRQYAKGGLTLPNARAVLVCVPDFEQHSLGAFMAANQFRRLGNWVQMGIGLGTEEILETVGRHDFTMIGLSAASTKSVAPMCCLIDKLRTAFQNCAPIVIGGNVVNCENDLKQVTGADLVTTDVKQAVRFCEMMRRVEEADGR